MFLRFPTLGSTEKLELDLFCLGADEWPAHARPSVPAWARLKPPLIPFVGCSLGVLFMLIAHLFKI